MMRIVSRLEYEAFMRVVMVLLVLFRTSESCLSVYPFIVSMSVYVYFSVYLFGIRNVTLTSFALKALTV